MSLRGGPQLTDSAELLCTLQSWSASVRGQHNRLTLMIFLTCSGGMSSFCASL